MIEKNKNLTIENKRKEFNVTILEALEVINRME